METKLEVNRFNINKICRTCLIEKDDLKTIFAPDESIGQSIAEMIMDFTNIQLKDGDGLPWLICLDCVRQAKIAFSFKQLCEKSDANLRQFLQIQPIVVEIKKEEEEVETADNEVVGGLINNSKLEDSSNKLDIKDEDLEDFSLLTKYVDSKYECSLCNCEEDDENDKDSSTFIVSDQCDVCRNQSVNLKLFEKHLKTHSKQHTDHKPFLCSFCGIKFTQHSSFKRHLRTHIKAKTFDCDICQKRFLDLTIFKRHKLTHTNERPYECHICQKRFFAMKYLKKHLQTHTNERPFQCNICQRRFLRNETLKRHKMMHTDERPFECKTCHKGLTTKTGLKNHMRTHTNERPFVCEFCKKAFKQSHHLTKHKQRAHMTKTN